MIKEAFRKELESLINRNSQENSSNTSDFILADYLCACLVAFDSAVNRREEWYGRGAKNPQPEGLWPREGNAAGPPLVSE